MVSLFFIIFLALAVFFLVLGIKEFKSKNGNQHIALAHFIIAMLAGITSILFLSWVFQLIDRVGTRYTVDNKIKMYEEEKIDLSKSKWKLYFGK